MEKKKKTALLKQWDSKLKEEEGLDDNERDKAKRSLTMSYQFKELTQETQDYYTSLQQIVCEPSTKFKNDVHKYIMTRFASGVRKKKIQDELTERGTPRCKGSIRFIIRRYEALWNLRIYTAKQLHIVEKPPQPQPPHTLSSPLTPNRCRRGICR